MLNVSNPGGGEAATDASIVYIYTSCMASKHSHWPELFSVWLCLKLINRNYSACGGASVSTVSSRDGYFAVIAVRPRPASKRRRRFRPALGRTGRLTLLCAGQAKAVRYLQSGQAPCTLIFICPGFGRPPGSRTLSGRTANLKSGQRPAGPLRNTGDG